MPLARGDLYAGFTIVRPIGSGPTGTVYRAVDPHTGAQVALKILRLDVSSDPNFRERLEHGVGVLAGVSDPAIAPVIDYGESGARIWITSEYIDGPNARQLLRQRFPSGIPARRLIPIARRLAHTLDGVHGIGLIHEDLKPSNVLLVDPLGKNFRVALTDFGHGAHELTHYTAPEVIAGRPADPRSDQFSFAAMIFHLLTAVPPFGEARVVSPDGLLQFDTHALAESPNGGDGMDAVFARAFALDPGARFDSCSEFVEALAAPDKYLSDVRPSAARRGGSLRSVLLPASAALLVAVLVAVTAVVWNKPQPQAGTAVAAQNTQNAPAAPVPPAAAGKCAKLDAVLSQFSLRQKLAQLLMVGVTDIDDARAVVNDYGVGGLIIGSWTDLSMLKAGTLRELQSSQQPLPLAVSVDEEGGRVQRLKNIIGSQDSARQLVAEGKTPEQVREIAYARGKAMHDFGITVDFAPVVDLTDAPEDTVIGDRSFSSDPQTVVEYAGAYAQGLRDAGLLPVLKHFPGHGRATGDSHLGSVTTPPLSELMDYDLIPYRTLTTKSPVAVMVGHMQVPDLTGTDPASLSAAAYELLRSGNYGGPPFDGLIYTDDLSSMGAINQRYSVPQAVLRAIEAGADVALWITTTEVPAVLDMLEAAVNTKELDIARVDAALKNVAVTKNPDLAC